MRRLEEIEKRCSAATPPLWNEYRQDEFSGWWSVYPNGGGGWLTTGKKEHAAFFGHASEDVPALLAVAKAAVEFNDADNALIRLENEYSKEHAALTMVRWEAAHAVEMALAALDADA